MVRAAEVEVLIAAPLDNVEEADRGVKTVVDRINKTTATQKVKGDEKDALASMDRVETAAKKLVSSKTALKLDADISAAEKGTERLRQRLQDLEVKALGGLDVTASTTRAERELARMERSLDGLRQAKTMIEVDADISGAESALESVKKPAAAAGQDAGNELGDNIVAALLSIPIAGAVVGIGVAAGKALFDGIQDGLQQEVGRDRLQALTGIDEASALRLSRAAGQAYTQGFGESIEQNMDTSRLALQFDIIDGDATSREAQKVVAGLAGISDALGEDVRPIATTVTTLMRTGLAASAKDAFDILAAGEREGLNRADDLLDTFTEYPVVLRKLGLGGKDALDLLNQGLKAGARNSDVVADALKEFQIRATDGSTLSAAGFERLGLSAEDMTAKIARGGSDARAGLDEVLQKLRETEDPVVRNAAAVELFGTKAEDLGDALFALDLDSTTSKFDDLQGSAQRMFDTLADNDASKILTAQRNIEVAADGIKGALASAFSEPIGDFATFVAENRGPVLQFLSDLANGAFDFGENMVNAAADGSESLGDLVSGPLAAAVEGIASFLGVFDKEAGDELKALSEDMRGFDVEADKAAATMRDKLLPPIDQARDKFNGFMDAEIALGFLNDASLRLADAVGQVGYSAEGAVLSLDGVDAANLRTSRSGLELESQIRNAIAALGEEVTAAGAAGEGQDALTERYKTGTEALANQLIQMGLTEEQARALIDTVLKTPASATTQFGSNARDEQGKVEALANRIVTLPDGTTVITANASQAKAELDGVIAKITTINGTKFKSFGTQSFGTGGGGAGMAAGGVLEFMARGGIRGMTPMQPVAQMVPPNTWRVVGDRGDVPEAFIPLDGSARSMAILFETMRRMGVLGMADGGILSSGASGRGGPVSIDFKAYITTAPDEDTTVLARGVGREFADQIAGRLK